MRVAVIGQGYVGLTISMGAVTAGHHVVGIDLSEDLVRELSSGKSHIEGISDSDISSALGSGRYRAATDYGTLGDTESVVIAVPTPLDGGGKPDLKILESAAKSVGKSLKNRALIVNESRIVL